MRKRASLRSDSLPSLVHTFLLQPSHLPEHLRGDDFDKSCWIPRTSRLNLSLPRHCEERFLRRGNPDWIATPASQARDDESQRNSEGYLPSSQARQDESQRSSEGYLPSSQARDDESPWGDDLNAP